MLRYALVALLMTLAACSAPESIDRAGEDPSGPAVLDEKAVAVDETGSEPYSDEDGTVVSDDYVELSNETFDTIDRFVPAEHDPPEKVALQMRIEGLPENAPVGVYLDIEGYDQMQMPNRPVTYRIEWGRNVFLTAEQVDFMGSTYVPNMTSSYFVMENETSISIVYRRERS